MKKNIVIGLLSIISLVSVAFGLYQKKMADQYAQTASANEKLAKEMRIKAEEQARLAEKQMRIANLRMFEAERQRRIAESGN